MIRALLLGLVFISAPAAAQTAYPPFDPSNLQATVAQAQLTANSAPQFVAGGSYLTQAQLAAQYPPSASIRGKLAHISDAWGGVSTTLVDEYDPAFGDYWRPQRTDYAGTITIAAGQSVTLVNLQTPPIVILNTPTTAGIVSGSATIVAPATCPWPGASFHIYAPATIGIGGAVNIGGLVGGGTVPMVQGSDKILSCTSSGWKSN